MAKPARATFVCQNCGAVFSRWTGKCASCEEWNTLVEESDVGVSPPGTGLTGLSRGRAVALESRSGPTQPVPGLPTGITELDRVTGGASVPRSALLIGGAAGTGKPAPLL